MRAHRAPSTHERRGGIALGTRVPLPEGDTYDRLVEILDSLLSSAPAPIVVLDRDLRIVTYTGQATSIFALSPEDVGRPLADIPSDLTAENIGRLLRATLDSGRTVEEDTTDRSGRWYRLTIRPVSSDSNEVTGIVVTLLDIDAERRLNTQTARIEFFDSAAIRVAAELRSARDPELATRRAISILAESLGASGHELMISRNGVWSGRGREPVADVSRAGVLPGISLPLFGIGGALLGEVRLTFDEPRGPLDMPERCFSVRAAEIVARGLEQTQQLEALEQAMLPLETALSARDEFLGRMSHELRTPLNSIIGFSKVLLKGMSGDLNQKQSKQIEMIYHSGNHLLALVSNLLDLEKIVAGAMPVSTTDFDMGEIVEEVVEMLLPLADTKDLDLHISMAGYDVPFHTDKLKVRQILLNLVSNAIKFTDAGHITVNGSTSEGTCTITVADTGRGMTGEQLEQAFREFEQVDQGPDRVKDGTGLGLSIAVRLARLLGGDLTAESAFGIGSVFTLTLPCRFPGEVQSTGTGKNSL